MNKTRRTRKRGTTLMEAVVTISVIAVLLGLAVPLISMARKEAHVTQAVTKLRQVSTGLDLYFNDRGKYPRQGSDLASVLADFVPNPKVFSNPLMEEPTTGHTVSALYQEPTLEELDHPEIYLTSMISKDGDTVVILKTLGKVDRLPGLEFDPWSLLSTFNATGRRLLIVGTSTTQYGTRTDRGHGNNADQDDEDNRGQGGPHALIANDGTDEDELRGGGTRFDSPHSLLGGTNKLQAHVFSVPVSDTAAVWNVSIRVETRAGSAGPVEIPKSGADEPGRLGGLKEVGLGFWAKYQVEAGEIRVTIASDGKNTPDPLTGLNIYVSGTEVPAQDGGSQEVIVLDLE